jgi:hypothetical protein
MPSQTSVDKYANPVVRKFRYKRLASTVAASSFDACSSE